MGSPAYKGVKVADEDQNEETTGKGLRAQLEAALAANKELSEELNKVKGTARKLTVAETLRQKGIRPGVAKFIGNDVEDIEAWLQENAEDLGIDLSGSDAEEGGEQGQGGSGSFNVDPEVVAATKRVQQTRAAGGSPGKLADLESRMKNATSDAEVDAIFAEAKQFLL